MSLIAGCIQQLSPLLVITECNIQILILLRGTAYQVRQTKCQDEAKLSNDDEIADCRYFCTGALILSGATLHILVTALVMKKMPMVANLNTINVPLGIGQGDYPLEDRNAFRGKAAVILKSCQASFFFSFLTYIFNLKIRAMMSLAS